MIVIVIVKVENSNSFLTLPHSMYFNKLHIYQSKASP